MNRIVQLTPCITFGDAVSNDVFAMSAVLTKMGYENIISAIGIGKNIKQKVLPFSKLVLKQTDIVIFHMSIGSEMSEFVIKANIAKKIMVYHNITPPEFFKGFPDAQNCCIAGRKELELLKDH
ncbi:MAG: glycosyltransferase, partial [Oscillospiraceae bacterium]